MSMIVGLSSGWMCAKHALSPHTQMLITKGVRANGIEACLRPTWEESVPRIKKLDGAIEEFRELAFRAVHLPVITQTDSNAHAKMVQMVVQMTGASVAVTHPTKFGSKYPMASLEAITSLCAGLAIENLDRVSSTDTTIKDFKDLADHLDCGFVLDVEHAFEHDKHMFYARELLSAMKDRLRHFHVSGNGQSGKEEHALIHLSKNRKRIMAFLGWAIEELGRCPPIILEGDWKNIKELRKEVEFLRKELS